MANRGIRMWAKAALAGMLLSVLGACGSVPTPAPTPIPATATATEPPTATSIPTTTNTPFVPKAVVKIVSQSPDYPDIREGAQLAVEVLAGPLQDLGYEAQYVPYDDQNDVDVAIRNAKELIADPEVLCGVGHYTSRVTINLADLYHVAGLAFISPSATNPEVTQRHYLEINRVAGRDDMQATAAVKFVQSEGLMSIFIVRNDVDYFNRVTNQFKREADPLGLKIAGDMKASVEAGNFTAVSTHVIAAQPDVVLFSGWAEQAGIFFKQVRLDGYSGVLLAITGDPSLAQNAGPLAMEGGGLFYVADVAAAQVIEGAAQFAKDFEAVFGRGPQPYAALAYDAAGICLRGIEEASKAKGGELPSRAEVAQAIRATTGYAGITGTFGIDANGDRTPVRYYAIRVTSFDAENWHLNPVAGSFDLSPAK
jgi:branched-chain amino acid transport system substrate-binding protein